MLEYFIPLRHGQVFFSSPARLDQLWGKPGLLSNGYQ